MSERTGACLCGAVRFTARDVAPKFTACHCKMCQRWVGGAFLAVSVPAAGLDIEGAQHVRSFASSELAERAWCGRCGAALWYRVRAEGADHEMALGLFDDTSGFAIASEIFIDSKPGGYALAGDHRRMTEAEVMAARERAEEGDA